MSTALVLIDLQQGLFAQGHPALESIAERLNRLVASASAAAVPVIAVYHQAAGTAFMPGEAPWQWLAQIPLPDEVIRVDKTTPDSFLRTSLAQELASRGITRLVVAGYASEFCIDTTVRSAAAHGYAVDLVADGHLTHNKPHADFTQIIAHENATLSAIKSFGVAIRAVPAAEVRWDAEA